MYANTIYRLTSHSLYTESDLVKVASSWLEVTLIRCGQACEPRVTMARCAQRDVMEQEVRCRWRTGRARTLLAPTAATQDPALSPDTELERNSCMYVCIIMAAPKVPTALPQKSVPPRGEQEICRPCLSGVDHPWFRKTDVAKYGMSYKEVIVDVLA